MRADGGAIGLVSDNGFLEPRWSADRALTITLGRHLRRHMVAEGPAEIDTVADLAKAGGPVPAEAREAVLSTNWLSFLPRSLPHTAP